MERHPTLSLGTTQRAVGGCVVRDNYLQLRYSGDLNIDNYYKPGAWILPAIAPWSETVQRSNSGEQEGQRLTSKKVQTLWGSNSNVKEQQPTLTHWDRTSWAETNAAALVQKWVDWPCKPPVYHPLHNSKKVAGIYRGHISGSIKTETPAVKWQLWLLSTFPVHMDI